MERNVRSWGVVLLVLYATALAALAAMPATAQVTRDGTLGSGTISLVGNKWVIRTSHGEPVGKNLFHSFGLFNIAQFKTAEFVGFGEVGFENVIARITEGRSTIDGKISSTYPNADVYLINPKGFVFGATATLNVEKGFHVSTADHVKLGNNGRFDATNPSNSTLTVDDPRAFGFVSGAPGSIDLNGSQLRVDNGETISIVGGDITMSDGFAAAFEGRVNIVSVGADASDVNVDPKGQTFRNGGQLRIIDPTSQLSGNLEAGGGDVVVRAGRLFMSGGRVSSLTAGGFSRTGGVDIETTESVVLELNSRIESRTLNSNDAGDIKIVTSEFRMRDAASVQSDTTASGGAGRVSIESDSLSIVGDSGGGSFISADSTGSGNAGEVSIRSDTVAIDDTFISARTALGTGDAGSVTIIADVVTASGTATVDVVTQSADSTGNAGTLTITANTLVMRDQAVLQSGSLSAGDGGNIDVTGNDVKLLDQSAIASATFETGDGGNINLTANTLTLSDDAVISSGTEGVGQAGTVTLNVGEIRMADNSIISSQSEGDNVFVNFSKPPGLTGGGDGGSVEVNASALALRDEASISSGTGGDGAGGNLRIVASDLMLEDRSQISATTLGSGAAGRITLRAQNTDMADRSQIESGTEAAGIGGNLKLVTRTLDMHGASGITATSDGTGTAGQIEIEAREIVMSNRSEISTGSRIAGDGGDITVVTDNIRIQDDSQISAVSLGAGLAGNISVSASDTVQLLGGSITSEAESSDGGDIEINAVTLLYLLDGQITTSVSSGDGDGGNIFIDPLFVVLNNSSIIANANGGAGGNITIVADNYFRDRDPLTIVDASSNLGIDGSIIIDSPTEEVSSSLTALPGVIIAVPTLQTSACDSRTREDVSRLILLGRPGTPPSPEDLLSSSLGSFELGAETLVQASSSQLIVNALRAHRSQSGWKLDCSI